MKVSVVIPAYNCERTICEAIESVLTQSLVSGEDVVEVIVVDNASTDATLSLVQQTFGNRVITASESRRGRHALGIRVLLWRAGCGSRFSMLMTFGCLAS